MAPPEKKVTDAEAMMVIAKAIQRLAQAVEAMIPPKPEQHDEADPAPEQQQ